MIFNNNSGFQIRQDVQAEIRVSDTKASHILEISAENGPIVTIENDGSHTFHKPDMIDEAARILWQEVSRRFTTMSTGEYEIVSKQELESLKRDAFELSCLREGGVDNWEWYHLSLQEGGFFDEDI
jgi:hypothetical protein